MSSKKPYIDEFYAALGKPQSEFGRYVDSRFLKTLDTWQIRGGPSKKQASTAIQEAVDALEVYRLQGLPDAAAKKATFMQALCRRKRKAPSPSPDARRISDSMKRCELQYSVLTRKFMLLDYWHGVARGDAEPELPADGAHWSLHYFLNYDPKKVRPILELLVADAQKILEQKHVQTKLETFAGADTTRQVSFDRTTIARTIQATAGARAGAGISGEVEVTYRGFKMNADADLFGGARARASGKAELTATSVSAKGSVEAELGIRFKANVKAEVLDVLEVSAGLDAIAGALAKAEAEVTLSYSGVRVAAGAEVFAGAKITGTAEGTLKIGGRAFLSARAEGALTAGAGATAEAHFECSLFGKVSVGAKAGATAGVGAEGGGSIAIDFHNARWGAANLFWGYLNEHGFKSRGKVWLLPLEENVQMCAKVRDALFKMMGEIYRHNEAEATSLERWKRITKRVSAA